MNVLKSNSSDITPRVDKSVAFWNIRAVVKSIITSLIVIGILNTAMNSSDIYFILASMI